MDAETEKYGSRLTLVRNRLQLASDLLCGRSYLLTNHHVRFVISDKALPEFVAPMTAAPVKEPFDYPDWIFETRMDGFREFAVIDFDAFASQPSRLSQ